MGIKTEYTPEQTTLEMLEAANEREAEMKARLDELLAALEKAALGLMAATSAASREGNDTAVAVYRGIVDIARAAIAKAQGK